MNPEDVPIKIPRAATGPKRVTVIMPYYENPKFFMQQIDKWWSLPPQITQYLNAIIVDDGSPTTPAHVAMLGRSRPFPMRIFRIEVDVRWNWLAARNIGAHNAATRWLALTDMDHVIPESAMHTLVYGEHSPGIVYRFSRREHTGASIHPHPNSWFMTKDMYWKIGGYDEDASGHYGTDGEYRRRVAATAPVRFMTDELVRHEYVDDASTTRYLRKQPEDARGKQILRDKRARGLPPKVLSFPHHEVLVITFVVWKWFSPTYRIVFTAEHVNTFFAMLKRHYKLPHRRVCITDDPEGITEGETFPLWTDHSDLVNVCGAVLPSCYRRLKIFAKETTDALGVAPGERVVSCDLDMVLVRDVTPIFEQDADFIGWKGIGSYGFVVYNGSLFMFRAGRMQRLWDDFDPKKSIAAAHEAKYFGSDQAWMSYSLKGSAPGWDVPDGVYSYSRDVRHQALPAGARIVSFNGKAKPWHPRVIAEAPWIPDHWRM